MEYIYFTVKLWKIDGSLSKSSEKRAISDTIQNMNL